MLLAVIIIFFYRDKEVAKVQQEKMALRYDLIFLIFFTLGTMM